MWKEGFGWTAVELGVGVAVALFLNSKAGMNGGGFVELGDSLKAGHATQRQCYMACAYTGVLEVPFDVGMGRI